MILLFPLATMEWWIIHQFLLPSPQHCWAPQWVRRVTVCLYSSLKQPGPRAFFIQLSVCLLIIIFCVVFSRRENPSWNLRSFSKRLLCPYFQQFPLVLFLVLFILLAVLNVVTYFVKSFQTIRLVPFIFEVGIIDASLTLTILGFSRFTLL